MIKPPELEIGIVFVNERIFEKENNDVPVRTLDRLEKWEKEWYKSAKNF